MSTLKPAPLKQPASLAPNSTKALQSTSVEQPPLYKGQQYLLTVHEQSQHIGIMALQIIDIQTEVIQWYLLKQCIHNTRVCVSATSLVKGPSHALSKLYNVAGNNKWSASTQHTPPCKKGRQGSAQTQPRSSQASKETEHAIDPQYSLSCPIVGHCISTAIEYVKRVIKWWDSCHPICCQNHTRLSQQCIHMDGNTRDYKVPLASINYLLSSNR